ncbi:MAG: hypothetical protein NWF07_13935 [Candidatus Bathyarchaeota archaeon]|nr:hypothetical protein [Candidatus Bathyarchaeota archaeon]
MKPMIKEAIERLDTRPSPRKLKAILVSSIILLVVLAPAVIYILELSGFPGELETTQLGFDAEYIRDCFASMTEQGLSLFILGNLVDYLFIASYGGMFFSGALLIARKHEKNSFNRVIGYGISILGLSAAFSDGLENIFLLSMVSNPIGFASWLAFPHSLFAHIKFKLMYLTAGWIALTLLYLVSAWLLNSIQVPKEMIK